MIQSQYGASMILWVSPIWSDDNACYAIEQASDAGFDLIELCLPPSMQLDIDRIKLILKKKEIKVSCGLNLPSFAHIPSHPKAALELIKTAVDRTVVLGATYLGGVLHGAIGVFTGESRTPEETETIVHVLGEAAHYAADRGVTIGIEPVNRYESYVCTSGEEVLSIIQKTGAPNLVLHLDTFHMNIEENNFKDPILKGGNKLQYIHMTESNRGLLGTANVHWDDLFAALNAIDYQYPLVLENFTNQVAGIRETTSLWRDSPCDAHTLATKSLEFMQMMVEKHSQ